MTPTQLSSQIIKIHPKWSEEVAPQTKVLNQILQQAQLTAIKPQTELIILNQNAEKIKINDIRNLLDNLTYQVITDQNRVVIFWLAENTTRPAQQALLKLLEEPPNNTHLILITTQPQSLLPTINSRCVLHHVNINPPNFTQLSKGKVVNQMVEQVININQTSYSDWIEFANQHKDRAQAIQALQEIIFALVSKPQYPQPKYLITIRYLSSAIQHLNQNLNVQLTLEHAFFEIKKEIKSNQKF